jgi:hypothetical protein
MGIRKNINFLFAKPFLYGIIIARIGKTMEEWELRKWHEEEVREILRSEKCMDSKGRIRAFKKSADDKLELAGHTSLDFFQCACRTDEGLESRGYK